jgi:tRNA/tmRNA/rRNA uracil-C5-methylase (TrmA/RlmC/RlmD family)
MKRKSSEVTVKPIVIEPPTLQTKKAKQRDEVYNCSNCGELPSSCFSNSKINQFMYAKITAMTCASCTCLAVSQDESEKSGKKKSRIEKLKLDNIESKQLILAKKSDPSALYESNPLEAPIISDAIEYFEKSNIVFKIHIGKLKGWRTVAKLAVRGELTKSIDGDLKIVTSIGLFQPGTHKVIKCLKSEAHHPSINICVNIVSTACRQLGINGYIEGSGYSISECFSHKSYLKYIIMAVERKTSKIQLTIVWNTSPTGNEDGDNHLKRLADVLMPSTLPSESDGTESNANLLFHSIWVNYNSSSRYNNAITCHDDDSWSLLFGKSQIKEEIVTDMVKPPRLRFPPLVFRQANIDAFSNIIRSIRHWIKNFVIPDRADNLNSAEQSGSADEQMPKINCVELYGGVGTIGLNCLDLFSSLYCSDENPHNKVCFDSTLAKMSSSIRRRARYESTGASPVARAGGLKGYDIVIVDPPRKGMDDDVIDALLTYFPDKEAGKSSKVEHGRQNNSRLIYVSCGFKAFKRDMSRLLGETDQGTEEGTDWASTLGTLDPMLRMSAGFDSSAPVGSDHTSSHGKRNIRYWKIVHAEGHVLFPGSDHLETFAVLDRVF